MLAKIRKDVTHPIKTSKFSHFLLIFVLPFIKNPAMAESITTIEQATITAVNPILKIRFPSLY